MKIESINQWFPRNGHIHLIAGPCSAETEEQVLETARQLKAQGLTVLYRAGIWKPRTLPGGFEGHGTKALDWLQRVKRELNMPVTAEVANAQHVREALNHGIDVLWIGARTTVNPFSVQEIADALKGTDIPVMVKNPINPDLKLWEGALKRLSNAGITKLAAIHRGFSSFKESSFRNIPEWEIAIELKRRYPDLPLLCDPSHICGNREFIAMVSQQAIDLNMDGLMIEAHPDPDRALTDAAQQITPQRLSEIIHRLVLRSATAENAVFQSQLEKLRDQIDIIDRRLMGELAERMQLVEQIGNYKRDNKVTVLQVDRWDEIIRERSRLGTDMRLDEQFVRRLLELIHSESIRIQTGILNQKPESLA